MKTKLPKIDLNQNNIFLTASHFSKLKKRYQMQTEHLFTERDVLEEAEIEYLKELNEKRNHIENQRYLIKLYDSDYSELFDKIKSECNDSFKNNCGTEANESEMSQVKVPRINLSYTKREKNGFEQFNETKYVNQSCMREFFNKYSKFNTLSRKHPLKKITPSWAFIKTSNEQKIVPNPLGLLRRFGNDTDLVIANQKVGDKYMKALSSSIKYSHHMSKLNVGGNRLSSMGTMNLFKSLNLNKDLSYKLRSIDLSDNKMGGHSANEIVQFIQDTKCNIEELNFFGNYFGDDNIVKICNSLAIYIQHKLLNINLGKNNIHDSSLTSVCAMINKCSNLRVLVLSHNWLHNQGAANVIKSLMEHYELKILDLSWNCIGDDLTDLPTYEHLVNSEINHPEREFNNFSINEALYNGKLKLRNNPLLPPIEPNKNDKKQDAKKDVKVENTAQPVYKEPKKINEKSKDPTPFAVNLGEYFTHENLTLIHLDISYNNLNFTDCKLIGEKSKNNHTLLGIHVDGNAMEINCLGFINPKDKFKREEQYYALSHIYYGMNKDYSLRKSKIEKVRKIRGKNNCWICEGFREIQFEYIPEQPVRDPNDHLVKLHLDFDDYRPFDMIYDGRKYHIIRMCPPGEVNYFFTFDTKPIKKEGPSGKNKFYEIQNKIDYIKYEFDSEYMEELNNLKEKLLYREEKETQGELTTQETEKVNTEEANPNTKITEISSGKIRITVDTINKIHVRINRNVINEDYRKTITFSEPRPEKIINKFIRPRTPWSFPTSIWAYYNYEYDDVPENYLDKCFEFDFDRCQFNRDTKDDDLLFKLKQFLRKRYRDIIDCYKYYASYSGCQTWQITQNSLTEFINKCPGMCDKNYDINNVYLQQKVVVGNLVDKEDKKKKNKNLGENIVRHQFMNLLVKASKDKYYTVLKTANNALEAVKMGFELHFDQGIKGFEYHKWRKERYYNEQVDNFLKTFLPLLDGLYLSWAKQKGPTKKDVWMDLDEFNALIQSFTDINEYPIRDNPYIFNQSLALQINEINSDKHLNMSLPEFLEALCRAIDKASPYPPNESKEDWPLARRQKQPLINKLENILPTLMKLITNPDYKSLREKFPMPLKDLATGLYTPNFDSPFYQGYIIKPERRKERLRSNITSTKRIIVANNENATKELQNKVIDEEEKEEEKNDKGESLNKIEENKTEKNNGE